MPLAIACLRIITTVYIDDEYRLHATPQSAHLPAFSPPRRIASVAVNLIARFIDLAATRAEILKDYGERPPPVRRFHGGIIHAAGLFSESRDARIFGRDKDG